MFSRSLLLLTGCTKSGYNRAMRMAFVACLVVVSELVVVVGAAGGEVKGKSKWGPDNPKPFLLRYQKYIGPFMAM